MFVSGVRRSIRFVPKRRVSCVTLQMQQTKQTAVKDEHVSMFNSFNSKMTLDCFLVADDGNNRKLSETPESGAPHMTVASV